MRRQLSRRRFLTRLGLATSVVPADSLDSEVTALARRLAAGPTLAYASIRASLSYAETHSLDDTLAFEGQMMARTGSSVDHRRAVDSFLAGEKPTFAGR